MNNAVIYLDNNATTPLDVEVYEGILPILSGNYGNPSSLYELGFRAKEMLYCARSSVARLLNAKENQIVFTSGATEANNSAIQGTCLREKEKKHIITSSIEHPSVTEPLEFLKEHYNYEVSYLPVTKGGIARVDLVKELIRDDTVLVSVMMVNNEVGTIQPVHEIGEICKEHQIHFHCDAVQGIGKLNIDLEDLNVDTISISAHKIYGPKGVGCLYIRNPNKHFPLIYGGSQEKGLRAGTENVAGIVGLGIAANTAFKNREKNMNKINELRDVFLKTLSLSLSDWNINGENTLPSTLSLYFKGVRGEALAFALSKSGVFVSVASACSSSSSKSSHVLTAMGMQDEKIRNTIRLSIGKQNTRKEMEKAAKIIGENVKKLRLLSTNVV